VPTSTKAIKAVATLKSWIKSLPPGRFPISSSNELIAILGIDAAISATAIAYLIP
jgi:hypothetical protein